MNRFGLAFHHLGLAVPATAEAVRFLTLLGYRQGPALYDPLQKVNLSLCRHDSMPDVELVWPGAEPSPIDRMLKRGGPLVYHFCYATADAGASLAGMAAEGVEVLELAPAQPAVLFGGRAVSFHSVAGFGLIELLHDGPPAPAS
jgi:hypothetical protein